MGMGFCRQTHCSAELKREVAVLSVMRLPSDMIIIITAVDYGKTHFLHFGNS